MTYSDEQLRGAILEEVVLYLLRRSGYSPLSSTGGDSTIKVGHSGLELRGRGAWHQIDSIADFRVTPPFGNPIRLLVEAKFLSGKVGLPIIRNSAGVLKDVTENWVIEPGVRGLPARQRYHYLCAVFSASEFTEPAQQYAYAQDIYLVPLARSTFIAPVIVAIGAVRAVDIAEQVLISQIRGYLRRRLLEAESEPEPAQYGHLPIAIEALNEVIAACQALRYGAIAMFGGRFPAFLVAAPNVDINELPQNVVVRIRWMQDSWYIDDSHERRLFSFDLPEELFRLYADARSFDRAGAAEMKGQVMSDFFAYQLGENGVLRVIQFQLDQDWYNEVRVRVGLGPY